MKKMIRSSEEVLIYLSGKNSLEILNVLKNEIISKLNKFENLKDFFGSNFQSFCKIGIYYDKNFLDVSDNFLKDNEINFDYLFLGPEFLVSLSQPALGMVYKIMEINKNPCIKFSEEKEKQTIPGSKLTYRLFNDKNEIICDYLCLENEQELIKDGQIEAL